MEEGVVGASGALPTGTVTFLFTDIEGSTVRWENSPDDMRVSLARHNQILRDALAHHGGVLFETAGDAFVIAFDRAGPALHTALWAQRALHAEQWPRALNGLRVRMALHTGSAEMTADGYAAQHTLSRQARLLSTGHGGQILLSRPTRDLVVGELPDAVSLRAMGRVWLKDLIEPEEIFQVVASAPPWSLPVDFPPLESDRPPPGYLPTAAVPFIGRESMVDEITTEVLGGTSRVTTLLGPGGIGKTRLALRVGERVRHHFTHGVYFVDLAAVTDPAVAVSTIAMTIGVSDEGFDGALGLGERLAEHEMLLVLDNLEQVIDVAVDVAQILTRAPSVRVLATSRIALRILEEAEYPVEPLGLADTSDSAGLVDLDVIERSEAVRLFVERSAASARGFVLTEENASDIAAICRRLEGMPLAIVLAAARSRSLEPSVMLERLKHRLSALTEGARDLPPRHQALRDTIEWSYQLLDETEQELYGQLSVHAGGFRLESAEAVAGSASTAELIAELVDASLLQSSETFDGDTRYRMLETIAEHAREKLVGRGVVDEIERRHALHFLEVAEEAATHTEDEYLVHWTERLDEEHDNVRAALASLLGDGEPDATATESFVRLAAAMGVFWLDRGHLREGTAHLGQATALSQRWLASAEGDDRLTALGVAAEAAESRGLIARRRGELDEALRSLERAVATYHELGDDAREARTLISIGTLSFHRGDLDEARAVYDRSLELSRSTSDRNTAAALFALGNLERDAGNADTARALYERSLEYDIALNDLVSQSVSVNNLANLALDAGDLDRAHELHVRSLEIRNRVGARMMLAESIVGLASVAVGRGRSIEAARMIGFAGATAETLGGEFDPMERRLFARSVESLRVELGEETFAAEARVGRAMTDAEAVDHATNS